MNMSDKNLDKAADAIKGSVDKVRDSIHESEHFANAEAEKARRESDPSMSATDKAASMAREAKERSLAEIDRAKGATHK